MFTRIYLTGPKIVLERLQRSRHIVNIKKSVEGIRIPQIQEFRGRQKKTTFLIVE